MEYLRRLVREFTHNVMKVPNQENVIEISRLDAYFNTIYKIVLWEDPVLTWVILAIFHVMFWCVYAYMFFIKCFVCKQYCRIVVQFHFRLYGIIFFTILIGLLTDLYFERIGLRAARSENSDAVRDTINIFLNILLYLKVLRKDNPPIVSINTNIKKIKMWAC